jgi:hypothetical protein
MDTPKMFALKVTQGFEPMQPPAMRLGISAPDCLPAAREPSREQWRGA